MTSHWTVEGTPDQITTGAEAISLVRGARAVDRCETIFISESGRACYFVTNGERVMVMLLERPGDAGGHASSPGAVGYSSGFVLSNGQDDEYPDTETVPWDEAVEVLAAIIDGREIPGSWVLDG